jgi:hypothetical protein
MSTILVDFTGVQSYTLCDEGRHLAALCAAEDKETQSGDTMIVAQFEILTGASKGSKVYENFPLTPKALWKLKQYMEALGVKADGKLKINTDKLMGRRCFIDVNHEEYDGKLRARIAQFLPIGKEPEPDDEEEEVEQPKKPAPKGKPDPKAEGKDAKANKKPAPKAEEGDDEDWEEA